MKEIYKEFFDAVDKAERQEESHTWLSRRTIVALCHARERIERYLRAGDVAYCTCKESFNKPHTTAFICGFCGKPPRP